MELHTFPPILLLLLLHFQSICRTSGLTGNCSNDISIPSITLDRTLSSIPVEAVFINNHSGENRFSLTCSHPTRPVRWELYSPDPGILMDVILNLYWRNSTSHFGSLAVIPNYNYKDTKSHLPLLFTCHTVGSDGSDPCSSRSYLYEKSFNLSPVEDDKSLYVPLKSRMAAENRITSEGNDCDIILRYRVKDKGNLEYKWETPEGNNANVLQTITKTASPDYFKGLYANEPQMPNCVRPLELKENCTDCKLVGNTMGKEVLTGVIFRGDLPTKRPLVAKGVFDVISSLSDQRDFHWEWNIPLEKMLKISAPNVFFVNQTEIITCTISAMFFALGGGDVTLQSLLDRNIPLSNHTPFDLEVYKPGVSVAKERGMREIRRSFVFNEEKGNSDSIVCAAPLIDFSNVISIRFYVGFPEAPVILQSTSSEILTPNEGYFKELACRVKGKPLPNVKWTSPMEALNLTATSTNEKSNPWETISKISISTANYFNKGIYKCTATNQFGNISKIFDLQVNDKSGTQSTIPIIVVITVGSLFVIILLIGYYLRRISLKNKSSLTEEEISAFLNGVSVQNTFELHETILPVFCIPFNTDLEIRRESIRIADENILGVGEFGKVYKGTISGLEQPVAIKKNKQNMDSERFKAMLTEIKVMAHVGYHSNIVRFIGACTAKIKHGEIFIALELCEKGSLKDFLVKHRQGCVFEGSDITEYTNNNNPIDYENVCFKFSTNELNMWVRDIAVGMNFLEAKNVIHGDLAARNILLTWDLVAKISDFGLSRQLANYTEYVKTSQGPLPWRWMAIEALQDMKFSVQSDVWSFGVTVWEIFTLGQIPYPGLTWSVNFVEYLEGGLRPQRPQYMNIRTYEKLQGCWTKEPTKRTSFKSIIVYLESIIDGKERKLYYIPEE